MKNPEIRKLRHEIAKLKDLVQIWENPRCRCIGVNEVAKLLDSTPAEIKKLILQKRIPCHFFKNGQPYFFENEIINNLKKKLSNK